MRSYLLWINKNCISNYVRFYLDKNISISKQTNSSVCSQGYMMLKNVWNILSRNYLVQKLFYFQYLLDENAAVYNTFFTEAKLSTK